MTPSTRWTEVPRIGQGSWQMEHDTEAVTALQRGLDLGLTHIDTAEMYGEGEVEQLVGETIAGRRDEVFLVSKVYPWNAGRESALAACERSLRRLGTDRLDAYLLHWPGSEPLEDTFEAFERLRRDGKVLSYGVSNFDVPELEQALAIAGAGNIACNQVLYHAGERAVENAVLPWCVRHDIPVVAYSPLGNGSMPAPDSSAGRGLAEVATRRGVSVAQVALRFVLRLPGVWAIPKASRPAHVEDNAAALEWALDKDEIALLERACPPSTRRHGIPML